MPIASIKIGVDLDPIPAIKGCVTFQCDITTQKCMTLIKKELKHFKADIVLNDGAPNVGANWSMDAYNQIELSLYALKVATETLRRGGWFITKVFRSKDYNALMYVANQLFTKVESNKPQSSRGTSAEIFMVCQGFKAPDIIDPKLLDPKYALE
jgi:AdoMet-dependent rRNA methyltransferase SPB1